MNNPGIAEEIRKALDESAHFDFKSLDNLAPQVYKVCANAPEWLRWQQGEIARLKKENEQIHEVAKRHNQEWYQKCKQLTEELEQVKKERDEFKSALRDGMIERDEIIKNLYAKEEETNMESTCVMCGKPASEAKEIISGGQYLYEDEGEWVCSSECLEAAKDR